jgi:hypothetical protein
VWIDGSMTISTSESIKWIVDRLEGKQMVFFRHPDRKTVREEYEFVEKKLKENNYYLTPRYKNEFNKEQMELIKSDKEYKDDLLIASTIFAYKNCEETQNLLKEWWYHISRYTTQDQYSLPYVLYKCGIKFNLIEEHYMKTGRFKYVRNK